MFDDVRRLVLREFFFCETFGGGMPGAVGCLVMCDRAVCCGMLHNYIKYLAWDVSSSSGKKIENI
jgi:hypothetical protein